MDTISLETTNEKFLISIDKEMLDQDFVINLVEKLRLEYLARRVDFKSDIEDVGEDIKAEWWKNNKERFLGKQ